MSLRDWLAGQALAGYLSAFAGEGVPIPQADEVGPICYAYADAVLAARHTQPQPKPQPEVTQ